MTKRRGITKSMLAALLSVGFTYAVGNHVAAEQINRPQDPIQSSVKDSTPMKVKTLTTDKGIDIWHVEDHTLPIVAVTVMLQQGGADDPEGKRGSSALMAQLLMEGAGSYKKEAYRSRLEELGVELSFQTQLDTLTVRLRTLQEKADDAFHMLKTALQEPHFEADAFERLRRELLVQKKRAEQDPDQVALETLMAEAYKGHPYALSPSGTAETLPQVTLEDVKAAHKNLHRGRLNVVVVGALSEERVSDLVDEVFGHLPLKDTMAPARISPLGGGMTKLVERPIPQSSIRMISPGLAFDDPDFMAAAVADHILGGGVFSSRLFVEVREKRGLAYGVWTMLAPSQRSSYMLAGVATRADKAEQSIAIINEQRERMAKEGPTMEELDAAKAYLMGSWPLRFDTMTKIASELALLRQQNVGPDYLTERNARLAALSLDDVKRAARRLYTSPPLTVIVGQKTAP